MIDPNLNPDFNPNLEHPPLSPPVEVVVPEPEAPLYDRKKFFDAVRADPFAGNLTQSQVDGMEYLLDMWEEYFAPNNPNDGTMWLAYCLATVFHETAQNMRPLEEYGKGSGHSYGEPVDPYGNCYYGRGHVQLTWSENYLNGENILRDKYGLDCPIHEFPERMLEDEPSALILMDGSVYGWFTGASLQQYFSKAKGIEDPVNARRVINGTDKADLIAGYFWKFKAALA